MSAILGREGGGGGERGESDEDHWEETGYSDHVDCAGLEETLTPLRRLTETEQQLENEWSELSLQAGRASRDTAARADCQTDPSPSYSHRYQYWGAPHTSHLTTRGWVFKTKPSRPTSTTTTRHQNYLKHKSVARFHTEPPARHVFSMIRVNLLVWTNQFERVWFPTGEPVLLLIQRLLFILIYLICHFKNMLYSRVGRWTQSIWRQILLKLLSLTEVKNYNLYILFASWLVVVVHSWSWIKSYPVGPFLVAPYNEYAAVYWNCQF